MFLGTHEPRLDEKGRLILPAKFREELAAGLVITKGQERCLYVFPSAEFSTITEQLRQAPVTAKSARDFFGSARLPQAVNPVFIKDKVLSSMSLRPAAHVVVLHVAGVFCGPLALEENIIEGGHLTLSRSSNRA